MADFHVINHGSIVTFLPLNEEGEAWWSEHVAEGQSLAYAHAVEPRYAGPIIDGIIEAGLEIQ